MWKELASTVLAAAQILVSSVGVSPETPPVDDAPKHIIHAAGMYKGIVGTNSLEALENAYNTGNRYIEIDFNFTIDLKPVCIHDWNHLAFSDYYGTKPFEKDFMNGQVYSLLSPMNLDTVADFMRTHEDVYIITDVKDLNICLSGIIKREHSDVMDRFIIQVYSKEEYGYVSKLGFENIIFSLYKLDWESKTNVQDLVEFAKDNKLFGYTFPAALCDIDGYVDEMLKSGIPLFVHTINNKEEQKKYFDMGISGIYTDNTTHE